MIVFSQLIKDIECTTHIYINVYAHGTIDKVSHGYKKNKNKIDFI